MPGRPCPAALLLLSLAAGCASTEEQRLSADTQVYGLIDARRAELFSAEGGFSVEPEADGLRQQLLDGRETGLPSLTLVDCLGVAAENSRDFQERREALYRVTLDLTLERWRFETQYGGTASGSVDGTGDGAEDATLDTSFDLSRLLGNGARIVASIGTSLFRVVSTGDGWDAISSASLAFTQPLLRGAGRAIAAEPLTQAERDLVYEVRSFERFRRTLAVDVASRVYRLLQSMDSVANEEANVARLLEIRKRNEALARAGLLSDIEVDQASQDELSSQNRLLVLRQDLEGQLDDFNVFLGLPVETRLRIDQAELERLQASLESGDAVLEGLQETSVLATALANRLDFLTAVDEVVDAQRRVKVAADALEAGLDFALAVGTTTPEGKPFRIRSGAVDWSAGFTLDLPLDRLPERNAFRSALLAAEASRRDMELLGDRIQADLRDLLREVATTQESYDLQVSSVSLAERRVRSTRLNQDAGRAETRDLLEAQRAELSARNARTRALIDHALARLRLFLEMEALRVDEAGVMVDDSSLVEAPEEP